MKRLTIVLAVALFAGTACWPFGGEEQLAEMSIRNQSGDVHIVRDGRSIRVTEDDDVALEVGDVIQTEAGVAAVRLQGEREATIGGGTQERAEAVIAAGDAIENRTGTVLVATAETTEVSFGDVTAAAPSGSFRVDQRFGAARVATFSGSTRVSAPGEATVVIPRLREALASAGDIRSPRPYQLNPADPFDRSELAALIELQTSLDQLTAGLRAQLGNQRPNLRYFRVLADGDNVSPLRPFLKRPTPDVLTAFTIATNARLAFADAIRDAFDLRDQGGEWGVVAAILRAAPNALVADLTDIIVATGAVAGGEGAEAEFTLAAAEAAGGGTIGPADGNESGGGGTGTGGGGGGGGDGGDGGDGGNRGNGRPEEPDECTDSVDCAREDIEDRVFGEPSPTPTSLTDGTLDI